MFISVRQLELLAFDSSVGLERHNFYVCSYNSRLLRHHLSTFVTDNHLKFNALRNIFIDSENIFIDLYSTF